MSVVLPRRASVRRFALNQNHDLNVTPFVDVMLVMLIVFMVAAPLATTSIKVDVAAGDGRGPLQTPVSILVANDGRVSIGRGAEPMTATSVESLGGDVKRLWGSRNAPWIVISAAPHARYGAFIAVLDRLHRDGFLDVTLASGRV